MSKLVLKHESRVIREVPLTRTMITIGRTPDNDLVIDNLAVSGQHARLFFTDEGFVVEDLESLNGTFVNGQRIQKWRLRNGDQVMIGKHTLVFQDDGAAVPLHAPAAAAAPVAKLDQTVVLDTRERREFLKQATVLSEESAAPAAARIPTLVVILGKTDQREYILTSRLALIGKSAMASVKLKRWFAPKVAAAVINTQGVSYQVAPSGNEKLLLNGRRVTAPRPLSDGDVIEVAGVVLRFGYRE